MANPVAIIEYKKYKPEECDSGICGTTVECPGEGLRQELRYEFPFSHPSKFYRGCAKCILA